MCKRLMVILTVFCILGGVICINANAAELMKNTVFLETETQTWNTNASIDLEIDGSSHTVLLDDETPSFSSLSEAAGYLREGMKNRSQTVALHYQTTAADPSLADTIFEEAVVHTGYPDEGDYLRYQFHSWSCEREATEKDGIDVVVLTYSIDYYTTKEQENAVTQEVLSLLNTIITDGMTDYEKIEAVYRWICGNVVYDNDNLNNDAYKLQYTAYAALINKTAVCQGYANLFYRMALELGIDARVITGTSFGENHAWNIVQLGDVYYNLDTTWDAGATTYTYFLKSEAGFTDHTRDTAHSSDGFYAEYPMAETDYSSEDYWWNYRAYSFSGGTGTKSNPYLISSAEELALLAYNVSNQQVNYEAHYFLQTADIDLSAHKWVPIGVSGPELSGNGFSGIFDGNGYEISGMNTVNTTYFQYGLFGGVSNCTIKNINLVGASIIGENDLPLFLDLPQCVSIGGIASELFGGTIENCNVVDLTVKMTAEYSGFQVGGVVGYMTPEATIQDVAVTGACHVDANGGVSIGGIVGHVNGDEDSTVESSWSTVRRGSFVGTIASANVGIKDSQNSEYWGNYVGGIVGSASYGCISISDCYADAAISASSQGFGVGAGALFGSIDIREDGNFVIERIFGISDVVTSVPESENQVGTEWVCSYLSNSSEYSLTVRDCAMVLGSELVKIGNIDPDIKSQENKTDVYPLCSYSISELFTSAMDYDTSLWNIQDDYYPTLTDYKGDLVSATREHNWVSDDSDLYTCEICGICKFGANGDPEPNITQQPTDIAACEGYAGRAIVIAAGDGLTYEWWYSDPDEEEFHSSGVNTPVYTCIVDANTDGRRLYCVVTDIYGNQRTSDTVTISAMMDKDTIGWDLKWNFANGILTIDGTGEMRDFTSVGPWLDDVLSTESVTVVIGEGVTSIGGSAFWDCRTITSISMPNSLTRIGVTALGNCTGLTALDIPDTVTSIEEGAFYNCSALSEIEIPEEVQTVTLEMFSGCSNLQTIRIPKNVATIELAAFANCTALTEIIFDGDAPNIDAEAFSGVKATVYYPTNNSTWTEDVMQNYGGQITWVCQDIPKEEHVHSYSSMVVQPSCEAEGYTVYSCACGESYIDDYTPATGHNYTLIFDPEWKLHSGACDNCAIPVNEECSFEEGRIVTEARLDQVGEREYACRVCNGSYTGVYVYRLYGSSRYETAFAVADAMKEQLGIEKFENIIVASGNGYADALAGSYLATVKNAPILLVNKYQMDAVADYIHSNLTSGGIVYLLGGENAVPTEIETLLDEVEVKRLAGENRYETNMLILEEAGIAGQEILICTGRDFPDSLSASAVGKPILLVNKTLNEAQKEFLKRSSGEFAIIGGTGAVSKGIEKELTEYGDVKRLGGSNRYETCVLVAEYFFDGNIDSAIVAYSRNFPDGLCGGPLAYCMKAPLLLLQTGRGDEVIEYASRGTFKAGAVLGGTGLIDDATVNKIFLYE